MTLEYAKQNPGKNTYSAAKKYSELAVWEWADAHPHVDVTTSKSITLGFPRIKLTVSHQTVLPSYIYGPFPPKFLPLPKPDFEVISTTLIIYNLLFPTGGYPLDSAYIDFRDCARAHVGALDSKPDKNNKKRIIFSSPHGLTFEKVFDIIKKAHPELESRLATAPPAQFPFDRNNCDFKRIEEVTGMRKEDFHTLEEVMLHF